MADALERALSEMPHEVDEVEPASLTIHASQYSDLREILEEHAKAVSEWKPSRTVVSDLIDVCRAGSFTIA